ncbi:OsmC family peroxiredoxin [Entomomonas sp. E2T0]|uniref:OsmC family peroxiredoxin n=1 Tax=Entomomonas sp. E2T0 TaxID=2930213 RepID=UPI002228106E|nr:OsmC family peroxiredoxin [Entomomonas sp. E2T0]UYZ83749.1 OsmC family peroxiredoxin [Entomomonas sp. E2T0]
MKRFATSEWNGSLNEGEGVITTGSNALNKLHHTYKTRYIENVSKETSPEELIAAAHADCYSSMFKIVFEKEGFDFKQLETRVEVTIDDTTHEVTSSHIYVKAKIPNISKEQFFELATLAKNICPISKLLKTNILLDCELIQ